MDDPSFSRHHRPWIDVSWICGLYGPTLVGLTLSRFRFPNAACTFLGSFDFRRFPDEVDQIFESGRASTASFLRTSPLNKLPIYERKKVLKHIAEILEDMAQGLAGRRPTQQDSDSTDVKLWRHLRKLVQDMPSLRFGCKGGFMYADIPQPSASKQRRRS